MEPVEPGKQNKPTSCPAAVARRPNAPGLHGFLTSTGPCLFTVCSVQSWVGLYTEWGSPETHLLTQPLGLGKVFCHCFEIFHHGETRVSP